MRRTTADELDVHSTVYIHIRLRSEWSAVYSPIPQDIRIAVYILIYARWMRYIPIISPLQGALDLALKIANALRNLLQQ